MKEVRETSRLVCEYEKSECITGMDMYQNRLQCILVHQKSLLFEILCPYIGKLWKDQSEDSEQLTFDLRLNERTPLRVDDWTEWASKYRLLTASIISSKMYSL